MAFNPDRLSQIISPLGDDTIRIFNYETDDAISALTATGYFVRAGRSGIRVSDLVLVSSPTGDRPYILVIESVDGNGTATAILGDPLDLIDEDDMASDSNVKVPTQQSVKAYVDRSVIDLSDVLTPYRFGASPADAYSADQSTAVQALVDAARATYDADTNTFRRVIDLGGRMWTVGTSINLTNLRQVGLVIKNGGLHGKCAGRPVL